MLTIARRFHRAAGRVSFSHLPGQFSRSVNRGLDVASPGIDNGRFAGSEVARTEMPAMSKPLELQQLPNGYELINGVESNALNGERFEISSPWFRHRVAPGQYVEVRIDSNRFSAHEDAHEDATEDCRCDFCDGSTDNPVLCHEQPASLVRIGRHAIPSRGWGEQFWVKVTARQDGRLSGVVDNTLYETYLHGLEFGDPIVFEEDHILTVHPSHDRDLLNNMDAADRADHLKWVRSRGA